MALTDDSLLRGHALRGLSKYFDYKNVNFLYSRQMSVLVLFLSSQGYFLNTYFVYLIFYLRNRHKSVILPRSTHNFVM